MPARLDDTFPTRPDAPAAGCPVCGKPPATVADLGDVPAQDGLLWPDRDAAVAAPTGRVAYAACDACGHVWNVNFDASLLVFDPAYDINLAHSPTYRDYLDAEAERLIGRYHLHGRDFRILEAGCGKGDFLDALRRAGDVTCYGFDPTFDPGAGRFAADEAVTVVADFLTDEHLADLPPVDLVVCRGVVQYFRNPRSFLGLLRRACRGRPVPLYLEVPSGDHFLRGPCVWNVGYEYANWYTTESMMHLLEAAGYRVADVSRRFAGGQNLTADSLPAEGAAATHMRRIDHIVPLLDCFAEAHDATVAEWSVRLDNWFADGERVALWGCGNRGIHLLNRCDRDADRVGLCVDINPRRQGRFVPTTGHAVESPDALRAFDPTVLVVSHDAYADEIARDVAAMGLTPQLAVLPSTAAGDLAAMAAA